MGKDKLKRFEQNSTIYSPWIFQPTKTEVLEGLCQKGKWGSDFFKNDYPILLELGCGRGEYSIKIRDKNPYVNVIGIDIKGSRLWEAARQAHLHKYDKILFIRTKIEFLRNIFAKNEISEIWLTFPDPQIKYRRAKHRLTHPLFLDIYKDILKPGGHIHLKTDSEFLHGYTLGLIEMIGAKVHFSNHDIYHCQQAPIESLEVQTYYEQMFFKTKNISYLIFSF